MRAVSVTAALTGILAGTAASTSVALAATVITVSGNTLVVGTPMEEQLGGQLCDAPNTCEALVYPAGSVGSGPLDQGVVALEQKIVQTPGDKVVMAYSQGGLIATSWLQEHADDADAPPADELSFVLLGNPQRGEGGQAPTLGVGSVTPTDTQYRIIDVARQYDGEADWPKDPLNGLAVANALAGYFYVHRDYTGVDVNSPDNLVKQVGQTTYVLVPTENLPLLEPLRMVGLSGLADTLNGPLKDVVEAGYDRSGFVPPTGPVLDVGEQMTIASTRQGAQQQAGPSDLPQAIAAGTEPAQIRKQLPSAHSIARKTSAATVDAAEPTTLDAAHGGGVRPSQTAVTFSRVRDGLLAHSAAPVGASKREQASGRQRGAAHLKNERMQNTARAVARALSPH